MDHLEEFTDLMQRIRNSSEGAAQMLFERYAPHVLRVIRRKLDRRLRKRFDSMDFSQEVWASFFAIPPERFMFANPQVLVHYLASMAEFKVIERFRQQFETQKYDLGRETSVNTAASDLASRSFEAGPEHHAVANERWEAILSGQTERSRRILTMLRENYTHREIAQQLGINEKTVRRLIRRLDASSSS